MTHYVTTNDTLCNQANRESIFTYILWIHRQILHNNLKRRYTSATQWTRNAICWYNLDLIEKVHPETRLGQATNITFKKIAGPVVLLLTITNNKH